MSRRRLISERDVLRAYREGSRQLAVGNGIITPSARDAAAKLRMELVGEAPRTAGGARPDAGQRSQGTAGSPAVVPANAEGGQAPRVALGADHGGVAMKDALLAYLRERGASVQDVGTFGADAVDYPDYAIAVARAVASGAADVGIMVDGAGIGSCMAANKVAGVRAALCYDVTTAANAREHNHANVLTLGGTLIGTRLAQEIVRTFLDTPFGGSRHARRVAKIDALDATEGRATGARPPTGGR
jgi:ribose 5-phosphate isomerase B